MFGLCVYIILLVGALGYTPEDESCNYVYTKKCHGHTDTYFVTNYTLPARKLCTANDVPKIINYTVMLDDGNALSTTGLMKVEFPLPEAECVYKVSLLQIPLSNNQSHCENELYPENVTDEPNVHTTEKSICIVTYADYLADYEKSRNSSLSCQKTVVLWYRYIFTGCYTLRFLTGTGEYIFSQPKFLRTNYQPTSVIKPIVHCSYDIIPDESTSTEEAIFETGISIDPDISALSLNFVSISESNRNKKKACILYSNPPIYTWSINLINNQVDDHNCSIIVGNTTENGIKNRKIECNFKMGVTESAGYCFTIRLIDERCHKQTLWNPQLDGKLPCIWIHSCTRVPGSHYKVGYTNLSEEKSLNIGPSLLLSIVVLGLSVIIVAGLVCFLRSNRKRSIQLPLTDQHGNGHVISENTKLDDSAIPRISDETEGEDDASLKKDIVLVYTRGSGSFMALMRDFSAILSKQCRCRVHDWYAANEWNNVAKVGATEWFSELLKNDCRVVWIDTPMARALVPSKFNNNVYIKTNLKRKLEYEVEIGDFRDTEFPAVVDLAKRNIKHSGSQYHMHFIVRLKGFEASRGSHDPFVDLSPYARYLLPEHLGQLCAHLSTSKLNTSSKDTKADQDLLEQHLSCMKANFPK